MRWAERDRSIVKKTAVAASTLARFAALRLARLLGSRPEHTRPLAPLEDLAASGKVTAISTSGVCLLAPTDENFVRDLPALDQQARVALLESLGLPQMPAKTGRHTHVAFFEALYRSLADQYPNWEVLDVGGYVGVFGLPLGHFARTLPSGNAVKVTVFEPSFLAGYITRSIEINDLGGVVDVRCAAASSRAGTAPFASPRNDRVASRVGHAGLRERLSLVETLRLDDFVAAKGVADGTLILAKIDTEGHEPEVLSGFRETIARFPTILALEFHAACLGRKVGALRYEDFLFQNFHIYRVGNIAYPDSLEAIADGDVEGLRRSAIRGSVALTDLLCVAKRLPRDTVERAFAGRLKPAPTSKTAASAP